MSRTSGKIRKWLYKKFFSPIIEENETAMKEAILEERKWFSRNKTSDANLMTGDPFYAKFPERDSDYRFQFLETQYLNKKNKLFKDKKLRDELVKTIEATGWAPTGFEDAAFRVGSLDELSAIQDACFKKYILDPLGKSIVMNMQYFTVGRGVKINSVADDLDKWIKKFRTMNRMGDREKKMVRSLYTEGEYFLAYIKDKENVYLRKVSPSRIEDIKTKEDDVERIMSYTVAKMDHSDRYPVKDVRSELYGEDVSLNSIDPKASKYIQFIKYGEEEYVRGQPPMYSVLRYLRHYEDWIVDRMRLNHERAKVVWIRKRMGTETAKPGSPFVAPKGGIMLEETANLTYRIESAKLDSDDAKEDGLAILYSIGAGVQMPLHVLTQITSEAVYASLMKSDTPFSMMIESNQDLWSEQWDFMYRFGAKLSGEIGKAKFKIPYYPNDSKTEAMKLINRMIVDKRPEEEIIKEVKKVLDRKGKKVINATIDDVPISQVFPDVVSEDPLSVAKALFLHNKMKIVSHQTAAEKAGYNWQEELAKMIAEVDVVPKDEVKDEGSETVPGLADDATGDSPVGGPQV